MSNELDPEILAAIEKQAADAVPAARARDWRNYLAFGPIASAEFMGGTDDVPVEEPRLADRD
jgi:hypothetical protein